NGVVLPGATDSLLLLEGPGLYSVLVSDFVACPGVFSNDWTVVGVPGIEGTPSHAWSLFPNPADAVVQIRFPAATDWILADWTVNFYDASGKRVHSAPAVSSPMDVSALARGIYTVHLTPVNPKEQDPLFVPKRLVKR
ncbi:MAG: T9SS type A sorting domain-containing protein, partial [Flavobacteriales bacterium]|nr:T9SS type A sorting domain-containing protein [Flavobacteriales bacterium]